MYKLPQVIYRFSAICIKIQMTVFKEHSKICMEPQISLLAKAIEQKKKKKNKVGSTTLHDFKDIVIKTVWHWNKNQHKNLRKKESTWKWNMHAEPPTGFWQGDDHVHWNKDSLFNK
jgi:hypothetical protein